MQIKILDSFDSKNGYITASKEYLDCMGKSSKWIGGFIDGTLAYVLPFVEKKKLFFHYIQLQSETIVLNDLNQEQEFLDQIIIYLKKLKKYDFIGQPPTHVVFQKFPQGSIYAPFGSYIIDLSAVEEELWKNIHTKHKNVIKRAQKNDVLIKIGNHLFDTAFDVIEATLKRNKIAMISKINLSELLAQKPDFFMVGCSYIEDQVQSAAILLYKQEKAFYFWGGSQENMSLGANNLLHWEMIKKAKALGVKQYDFVGARISPKDVKLQGIQKFKSRFGSTLYQGYLWKYPLKIWKYKLFNFLYVLRMGKGDIIDQEQYNTNI